MSIEPEDVLRLTAVQLGLKSVRLEDRLVEDLDVTSVDLVNLTASLEDCFRVTITEDEAATLRTVADLHALMTRLSKPEAGS